MRYYRSKYRLAMQHSFDNLMEHKHNHVIEIETITKSDGEDRFKEFNDMESAMKEIITPYQNKYLNELEEFAGNTTIENIGEVIYDKLIRAYEGREWSLTRFEISETPLRVYAIVAEEY